VGFLLAIATVKVEGASPETDVGGKLESPVAGTRLVFRSFRGKKDREGDGDKASRSKKPQEKREYGWKFAVKRRWGNWG